MKNILISLVMLFCFVLFSCGSAPKKETEEIQPPVQSEETQNSVNVDETIDYSDDDSVELINEIVEIEEILDEDDEEYIRSTNELKNDELVTKEEFIDDKTEILHIISELQDIMEREDTEAWLKYISPDSIRYYSSPANIRKAQKKLPNKTIQLNGIGDYFKHVFIPSRKRSNVDEIRYISKTNIKAVEVKDDGSTVVYYQFVKVNGKWLVHIPTL
ncbi:MAG: hypothetical protein MR739_01290 [Spirochaetia bacterium]|nr:hypothetical protein [Spirochaetia bacterium]